MNEPGDYPLVADESILADLLAQSENMGTRKLTAYARSMGVQPPDDRPGWSLCQAWGPNGEDLGLCWSPPDERVSVDAAGRTVVADKDILADLLARSEHMPARELAEYARSLGLVAPSDEPGWAIVQGFNASGEKRLSWVRAGERIG